MPVIDKSFLSSTVTRWSVSVLKTENINWKGTIDVLFSKKLPRNKAERTIACYPESDLSKVKPRDRYYIIG